MAKKYLNRGMFHMFYNNSLKMLFYFRCRKHERDALIRPVTHYHPNNIMQIVIKDRRAAKSISTNSIIFKLY